MKLKSYFSSNICASAFCIIGMVTSNLDESSLTEYAIEEIKKYSSLYEFFKDCKLEEHSSEKGSYIGLPLDVFPYDITINDMICITKNKLKKYFNSITEVNLFYGASINESSDFYKKIKHICTE